MIATDNAEPEILTRLKLRRDPIHAFMRALLERSPEEFRACPLLLSRWNARIYSLEQAAWNTGEVLAGRPGPLIATLDPNAAPALAALAVGAPVNYAESRDPRPGQAGLRCHFTPNGDYLREAHPLVTAGLIERAWTDAGGVMATLAIWGSRAHADLVALDAVDALDYAGLCLSTYGNIEYEETPWSLPVGHIRAVTRVWGLDFQSLPRLPGCRVVGRLARGEEPDTTISTPVNPRFVPTRPPRRDAAPSLASFDIDQGAVGTPNLAVQAVSTGANVNLTGSVSIGAGTAETDMTSTSCTFTASGGDVLVIGGVANLQLTNTDASPNTVRCTVYLYRGAVKLTEGVVQFQNVPSGASVICPITLTDLDAPGSGSTTYKLRWSTGSFTSATATNRTMQAREMKR